MYEKIDKNTIEKLKRLLKISEKIKIDRMEKILKIDDKTFNDKILDWGLEFGLKIDGDYIKINQNSVDEFINKLDYQFTLWSQQESKNIGKVEKKIKIEKIEEKKEFDKGFQERQIKLFFDYMKTAWEKSCPLVIIADDQKNYYTQFSMYNSKKKPAIEWEFVGNDVLYDENTLSKNQIKQLFNLGFKVNKHYGNNFYKMIKIKNLSKDLINQRLYKIVHESIDIFINVYNLSTPIKLEFELID